MSYDTPFSPVPTPGKEDTMRIKAKKQRTIETKKTGLVRVIKDGEIYMELEGDLESMSGTAAVAKEIDKLNLDKGTYTVQREIQRTTREWDSVTAYHATETTEGDA